MSKATLRDYILNKLNVYRETAKDVELVWLQNTINNIDDIVGDDAAGMICRVWTVGFIYTFSKGSYNLTCDVTSRGLPEMRQGYHRYIDL